MTILLKTKADRNGNIYRLIINNEDKTLQNSFLSGDLEFTVTKKKIKETKEILKNSGYKEM